MNLGDRMKLYESIPRTRLLPKVPVLVRVDGKAFHTLARGMQKPCDWDFQECMWDAARHLCVEISGARIAYVQSDEISVLVLDTQQRDTQPWFDYDLQKIVSVTASLATAAFLSVFRARFGHRTDLPAFDSRAWNLPEHEVVNYFIWRQQDAARNSIQALASAHFSHKRLHGVNTSGMQDLLMVEKGINWNDCPAAQKRGVCVYREVYEKPGEDGEVVTRSRWIVDQEIPLFTADREYIGRLLDGRTRDESAK